MPSENRFEIVYREENDDRIKTFILMDKQTGVNYLYMSRDYGSGLTPLLDADGKPVVTR